MRLNAASNHSFNIEFRGFMKPYKDYNQKLYSFLLNNTTLSSVNSLGFMKTLL